ncbi:hypothetical protein HPG69_009764 [Diceros bicornis minor]|uniref:guanylate cyclase n=1 Tax=Diceros bicornis minor TaxID=77932 RepID=A0A7J7EXH4_DICBM|nr:hypothetical protein HPG69_009764 [Diceros bicornis minor]
MSGYDRMLWTLGGNLTEFIENLDALHSYLTLSYQERNGPSFPMERGADGKMLLHYYFDRSGLCHIVPGIIAAVAKDFFNFEVIMDILDINKEEERTGKKEHVVFLIVQKSPRQMRRAKTNRSQDSQDIQRDREALKAAFLRMKEKYLSVTLCPVRKSCWEVGISWTLLCLFIPSGSGLKRRRSAMLFLSTFFFDESLRVKQAGVDIQKYVPGLQTQKIRLDEYFSIIHPQVTFNIFSTCKFTNSQMIWMEPMRCMRYMCSPKLHGLRELEERKMRLSDIAPHDTTRDLILLNQQRLAEIELSNQLERKKEELWILSKHLAIEKKKTETLLYAMLPEQVANQLKEGKKVAAGEFKTCTILSSDVVTCTNICAACEPIQIVNMLNSMYSKFDRLPSLHEVETIGDAHMVVGMSQYLLQAMLLEQLILPWG